MNEIGLIGKKIGMTREFYKTGQSVPVTVIKFDKKYLDNVPIFLAYEDHNGLIGCLNCYYNKYFAKFKTILDNK